MHIGPHTLDDQALRVIAAEARAQGKVFSFATLATAAAPFDDGDQFLNENELRKGLGTIPATMLPTQVGEECSPAVMRALKRAHSSLEGSFENQVVSGGVPENFARIIIERRGIVASPHMTYISAYLEQRASGRIKRLRRNNTVYFEHKKFGEPERIFGPYHIDDLGVPMCVAPEPQNDGVDETALLASLPSQENLRAALANGEILSLDTFEYDATGDRDVEIYQQLSTRFAARLTAPQRAELAEFAHYKQFGSQTPSVNHHLRERPTRRSAAVALLDAAVDVAVALPPGLLLFRGAGSDDCLGRKGSVISDPAYLCTSLEPTIAHMFGTNAGERCERKVLLAIEIGEGVRGMVSGNDSETEIILPRDTQLTIVSKKRQGGYYLYHLRAG